MIGNAGDLGGGGEANSGDIVLNNWKVEQIDY
jgi:hypothetical protein